jgi:signal transduction histidine kinase
LDFPVIYSSAPILRGGIVEGLAVTFREVTREKQAAAEREQLVAFAEAARKEAEAANRAKDAFLSLASHELRRPLSSMLNWLHVLRSGNEAPHERALDSLERSVQLQAKLGEDLLDVSRIVSEGRLFFVNAQSVADELSALVARYQPRVVALDMSRVPDIEFSALQMLMEGELRAPARGFEFWLVGLNPGVLEVVRRSGLAARLGRGRLLFNARAAIERYQALGATPLVPERSHGASE